MSQKPITYQSQKPITQKPITCKNFTTTIGSLEIIMHSVDWDHQPIHIQLNVIYLILFYFIISNTSLLTITHTLIALVAIKVKSFVQKFLLRTY